MVRPTVSLNSLFLNVSPRPVISSRTAPRLVWNRMGKLYATYSKVAWTQSSADGKYSWGGDVDGGQWVQFTNAGGEQVFASVPLICRIGQTYILSLTVDAKTGTLDARNFQIAGQSTTPTGTWNLTNPALGRHALVFTATSSGAVTIRIGIGTNTTNTAAATLRVSNVMVEIAETTARTYPYEYVTPGDQRVYNYTHTNTLTGTLVNTPTLGTAYPIPTNSSVLVIGDSLSDTENNIDDDAGSSWGDFPRQMRRMLPNGRVAVNTRGVSGTQIAAITTQLTNALAETKGAVGASPYTICILEGGVNDMQVGARTLAQMQTDKLAQIAAVQAAGMVPVLVGLSAWKTFATWTAPFQTQTLAYNAWLKTLGYPFYDLYADSDDGTGTIKTSWGSSDGLHPSGSYTGGQAIMGQRLADLLMLVGA
jgi:lysophospholipase L1-like esterase